MTLRRYFKKAQELKSLSNVTADEVAAEVESVGYHDQDVIKDERFIPQIDFSNPANFARYGSAEEYYEQSIKRIYNTYPYDGSLKEKLEWENESSYIDLYIFDNRYPRTNGYAIFCADANQAGSDPTSTDGYGKPTTKEYIYFKGGPNTNPDGMSPYSVQFTGSNYYHTASNRESNLKFDLANKGVSIEFWLKKDGWDVDSTEKEVIFDLWNSGSGDDSAGYGRLRLELSGNTAATAVDALDTTGVKSANVDSAFSFTIPTSAGGEGGATTIRLSAAQSTAPPVAGAGSSIGIGFSDKTDAEIAALIINAINAVATTNIVFAVSNNGMSGYDSGITAAQGSSDTQITLTMDTAGPNLTTALAYTSLGTDIVDVTDFTGGSSPFHLTALSGGAASPVGFITSSIASSTVTTASVADGNWHHYAVTLKSASLGVTTRFYIDGALDKENTLWTTGSLNGSNPSGINEVTGAMQAYIGALVASPSGSAGAVGGKWTATTLQGAGKLSGSLDEFRYWKTQRTSKDIGKYWFTQVGGGTNSDPEPGITAINLVNTNLGVYYKFNEGITGITSTDNTVLDYSGRVTNGTWTGYTSNSRNLGSAIVSASAATKEFKDPIIYPTHPSVTSLESELAGSGSWHDTNNNASLYGAMPGWVSEEDELGSKDLKYLTQIMGSYLDTLHLQIEALSKLKDKTYPSGSNKPLVFANRLLESNGLIAPEMFLDADILEKLADRSEKRLYEKTLTDIKNTIYQNIYNNLSFIYKSKGTEKSFRNLIRCYGIDDELIKFNLYANNIEYELQDNVTSHVLAKRFVDFNTSASIGATVYQTGSAIAGSTYLTGGFAFTTEANVTFPIKAKRSDTNFISNEFLTSSIFGLHKTLPYYGDPNSTTWEHGVGGATDEVNFQVYALRDEIDSTSVRFRLTGTTGGFVPELTSDLYEDVYDNTNWTLAVRIKPEKYPYAGLINYDPTTGSAGFGNYIVELHGINVQDGALLNEFNISASYTANHGTVPAFVTGSRRLYAGAHRTNFTGSIREYSDVKVGSVRHWLNYLEDATLLAHAKDIENFGTLHATRYPYPFLLSDMSGATRLNGLYASFGELTSLDTLVLNWDFNQITSSNASGEFTVRDYSSGSALLTDWKPGIASGSWIGTILTGSNSGQGYGFASNDTKAIDKDYITAVRQNLPENLSSQDMIEVYDSAERDMFFKNIRPTNFSYAFEKSMYQIISEEMLRYFATIRDLHNLIGEPVNRYRMNYKMMGKARQAFFAKVQNETIDFDKFYEYYKWFDSSLSIILMQLVPASADVAENIRMMIESHVLERNKYQTKFPTADFKDPLGGPGSGLMETTLASTLPPHPQQGGGSSGDILASGAPTMRQIGSSGDRLFGGWRFNHAPLPLSPPPESKNKDWWKGNAKKTEWTYGGETAFNKSRQALFNKIEQKACKSDRFYNDVKGRCLEVVPRNQAPAYRFSMTIEPVYRSYDNYHQNKRSGIVFGTTQPAGSLRTPNLPINVALGLAEDREQLMDVQDEVYPHFRQRLGFKLDSVINKPGDNDYLTADGNITAPFSLYSSSVTTEHNALVVERYAPGVEITNLHNDGYGTIVETPLQGLFTETWVGGHEHRHVDINRGDPLKAGPNNLDSPDDRPEGFRLLLGRPSIGGYAWPSGALGIVDPQYPDPGSPAVRPPYLFDRPKANMTRGLVTKRPVNIRNILSTTSSTRLGNYSKNYQVIQTAGRSINDPFFQDQSFNFALNPETLATRGRTPMARPAGGIGSALFGGSTGFLQMDTDTGATWEALIGGAGSAAKAYSYALWINPSAMGDNYPRLISFGHADRALRLNGASMAAVLRANNDTSATSRVDSATSLSAGTWYHVVVTYAGGSHSGGDFKIYLNGADDSTSENTGTPDAIAGVNSTIGCYAANNSNYAGYMCDVVVWDRKLSASEVSKLYNGGTRIDPVSVARSGMLSYWPLAEPNIILDSIGGRNLSTNASDPGTVASRPNTPPVNATVNLEGQLDYELPGRTGSTSNKTVIVNRFSSPGSYEVLSRGYMDPAHEEKSVYNALPFRNLTVRGSGSGESGSIHVHGHLGYSRGLRTLLTLHAGPFGTDAQYGSVSSSAYNTVPSYHKINRNRRYRFELSGTLSDNVAATATITITDYTELNNGDKVNLIATDGTNYDFVVGSQSSVNGTFEATTSNTATATNLMNVINTSSGPAGTRFTATSDGAVVTVTQAIGSATGNTTITLTDSGTAGMSKTNFGGGIDYILTGSQYDNWWVQHPIPRADRGYRWIAESLPSGSDYFTYTILSGSFVTSLPVISSSDFASTGSGQLGDQPLGGPRVFGADSGTSTRDALGTPFNGMNTNVREPVTCRYNFLGFFENYKNGGTDTTDLKNIIHYINIGNEGTEVTVVPTTGYPDGLVGSYSSGGVPAFNALMLHRNGPWGHPTWKQIRGSEHPVVRSQRYTNIISQRDYESQFIYYGDGWQTTVHGIKSNTVTRYIEQPLSSRHKPISFVMEDTSNQVTALMRLSWANNLDYFSNEKLNNRLDIAKDATLNTPYRLATAEVLNSNAPTIEYTERIYPRETSVYQNRFRSRTKYTEQMGLASNYTGRPQIWNSSRSIRSVSSSALAAPKGHLNTTVTFNSQGNTILNASCWPLDGPADNSGRANLTGSTPTNAGTSFGLATNDLSGELFNNYCRFGGYLSGTIKAAAHYAPLVPIGSASLSGSPVYYGGAPFQAASNIGQEPYRSYEEHMQYIRLIGKDHSIVPEFRISEHIGTIVEDNGSNWLADLDGGSPGMFNITGAAINNSYDLGSKICDVADTDDFYKVYGADFWKYFKVIDSDLNGKVASNGQPLKKKLILECSALVKPLFYKGFYPVERTIELATLFSRSYGSHVSSSTPAAYRALIEPLFAPGILYNTIKSGIAVGNCVVVNPDWNTSTDDITGSATGTHPIGGWGQALSSSLTVLQGELNGIASAVVDFGPASILSASTPRPVNKYGLQRIPFEAILHPQNYLNTGITGSHRRRSEGYVSGSHIFDSGLGSSSLSATDSAHPGSKAHRCSWDGSGNELYSMAIDNFLCETVNFFLKKGEKERPFGLTTIKGAKEESEWDPVEEDKAYAMTVHMRRPVDPKTGEPDLRAFSMFNRGSAFGYPVALNQNMYGDDYPRVSASFAHVTPGYFNGGCSVTMGFVAGWTGKYNFDDIKTSLSYDYTRDLESKEEGQTTSIAEALYTTESPGYWFAQQIDQSIDLFDKATTDDGVYYMLQSKFETPVLNFAPGTGRELNFATPTANSNVGCQVNAHERGPRASGDPAPSDRVATVGMWCQSGSVPTDTSKGITISVTNPESVTIDGVKYRGDNCKSLAELVGLDNVIGKPVPVGVIAHKQVLEEAVIAVPFTVDKNRRKFFDASGDPGALARMAQNMQKYVFPPKFETELPLFFTFEFDYDLDRDDLTKLYQNVMFDSDFKEVEAACEKKRSQVCSCCIEDEKLINQIYGCIDELKWLVFKVKRRAKRNYDLLRREGVDSQAMLARKHLNRPRTPTYNWPYDYFSLVELIKIDATARYSSMDTETLAFQEGPQETSTAQLFRGAVAQKVIGEETPDSPAQLAGLAAGGPKIAFDTTIPTFGTGVKPRSTSYAADLGTGKDVIDVDRVFSQPGKKGGYER